MNRIFAIAFICITFYACKPGVPDNVIQPDKMEKVLFDMHVVEGYLGTMPNPDTAKIVASSYYKGVYKKFDIDSATYTTSLDYYYKHPDVLNKLYENLAKQFEQEKKINEKRLDQEALAIRKKELAKNAKVLVVPSPSLNPPKITFSRNPFTFVFPDVQ